MHKNVQSVCLWDPGTQHVLLIWLSFRERWSQYMSTHTPKWCFVIPSWSFNHPTNHPQIATNGSRKFWIHIFYGHLRPFSNIYHILFNLLNASHFRHGVPSGELTFCNGKSSFFIGKSTISMVIFKCYVSSPEGSLQPRLRSAQPNADGAPVEQRNGVSGFIGAAEDHRRRALALSAVGELESAKGRGRKPPVVCLENLEMFHYPLVMTNSLLLKMTIEIVDVPWFSHE